jgi:hypothetical protein
MGQAHDFDDLFPPKPIPGLGYVCSSCGGPAPCDPEHTVDPYNVDDSAIPMSKKTFRLLCDSCLRLKRLARGK